MWSKEEARNRKKRFFTNFGIYMKKYIPEYGEKIRWVNYRTGVNDIKFKIECQKKISRVCIDIVHKDQSIREIFYEQFEEFKSILNQSMDEMVWIKKYRLDSGYYIARIYTELTGPSINSESDWGEIYCFIEKNLIALHEFWEVSQDIFRDLDN